MIRLEIYDDESENAGNNTFIELGKDGIKISSKNVFVVGTESAVIGSDESASRGLKADNQGVNIKVNGSDITIEGDNVNIN